MSEPEDLIRELRDRAPLRASRERGRAADLIEKLLVERTSWEKCAKNIEFTYKEVKAELVTARSEERERCAGVADKIVARWMDMAGVSQRASGHVDGARQASTEIRALEDR